MYHSLYPLDEPMGQPGQFFGHPSWVYKAVSSVDGKTYTLLRIEGNESIIDWYIYSQRC